VPVVRGTIIRNYPGTAQETIGYVSFELHQRLIAKEEGQDETRFFSGKMDSFAKARQTILSTSHKKDHGPADFEQIVKLMEIDYLLDRGIRFLSTGEMRKVLIARALMKSPRLLILDQPFGGLDVHSRERLAGTINGRMKEKVQIILVTHRFEEIVPDISHVLCIKDCKVFVQGERGKVLTPEQMSRLYDKKGPATFSLPGINEGREAPRRPDPEMLVRLKNITVKYGDTPVLNSLNWAMERGQNWAILGPNGSGKTTLLSLIIGDNPQAYSNEIYLFGKRKGSGESIWDIKKRIGIVSSELQVSYRKRMQVRDVVLSGFFDSIGLYRGSTKEQHLTAQQWIEILGIPEKAGQNFDQLSYGEKRMVLLARSMVKSPELLILDEPCQGLDKSNRRMILDLIDHIGRQTPTHLLYVTHHEHEIPPCFSHVLRLEKLQ
jgi:molybdate transport system ATP-binding protein